MVLYVIGRLNFFYTVLYANPIYRDPRYRPRGLVMSRSTMGIADKSVAVGFIQEKGCRPGKQLEEGRDEEKTRNADQDSA